MTAHAYRRLVHAATFERSRFASITEKMAKAVTGNAYPTAEDRERMRVALDAALKDAASGEGIPLLADKATAEEISKLHDQIRELRAHVRQKSEECRQFQEQVSLLDAECRKRDDAGAEALANQKAALRFSALRQWMTGTFAFRLGKLHAGLGLLLHGLEGPNGGTDNVTRKIIAKVDYEIGEVLREGLDSVDHVMANCAPRNQPT